MKKLIEFKLHAGQFPYFVDNVIGGVDINGKRYGISKDVEISYLPDTVIVLTPDEFIEHVKMADIYKNTNDDEKINLMTITEKKNFATQWLDENLE